MEYIEFTDDTTIEAINDILVKYDIEVKDIPESLIERAIFWRDPSIIENFIQGEWFFNSLESGNTKYIIW